MGHRGAASGKGSAHGRLKAALTYGRSGAVTRYADQAIVGPDDPGSPGRYDVHLSRQTG